MTEDNEVHPKPRPSRRGLIGALVVLAILGGLVALLAWAVVVSRTSPPPARQPTFDRFEPAWASAMAKAGVEATFPVGPLDVTHVRASGSVPFEATFSAEEITALINVYRFRTDIGGQAVSFDDAAVEFPRAGVGALSGSLATGDSAYKARIEGPITYSPTGIDSPGATSLTVSGFTIKGARRRQASDAVLAYLNLYVRAAPGLVLENARIVEGGLAVKGSAPQRLENPAPIASP